MLRNPKLPDGFGGKIFIGKVWGECCKGCDFLLPVGGFSPSRFPALICLLPRESILNMGGGGRLVYCFHEPLLVVGSVFNLRP